MPILAHPTLLDDKRVIVPDLVLLLPLPSALLMMDSPVLGSVLEDVTVTASRLTDFPTLVGPSWVKARDGAVSSLASVTAEGGVTNTLARQLASIDSIRIELHYSELGFGNAMRNWFWPNWDTSSQDAYELVGASRDSRRFRWDVATYATSGGISVEYDAGSPYGASSRCMPFSLNDAMNISLVSLNESAFPSYLVAIKRIVAIESMAPLASLTHSDVWTSDDSAIRKDPILTAAFRAKRSSSFQLIVASQPVLFLAHLLFKISTWGPIREALVRMRHSLAISDEGYMRTVNDALNTFPLCPTLRFALDRLAGSDISVQTRHGPAPIEAYPDWLFNGLTSDERPDTARNPVECAVRWERIAADLFGAENSRMSNTPFGRIILELVAFGERSAEFAPDITYLSGKFSGWTKGLSTSYVKWNGFESLPFRKRMFITLDGISASEPIPSLTSAVGATFIGTRILSARRTVLDDIGGGNVVTTKPLPFLLGLDRSLAVQVESRQDPRVYAAAFTSWSVPALAMQVPATPGALAAILGFLDEERLFDDMQKRPTYYAHLASITVSASGERSFEPIRNFDGVEAICFFSDTRTESIATSVWVRPPSVTIDEYPLFVRHGFSWVCPMTVTRSTIYDSEIVMTGDDYYYVVSGVGLDSVGRHSIPKAPV